MGMKRDFAWSDGSTMQCAGDVLLSCTLGFVYGFCEPMSLQ